MPSCTTVANKWPEVSKKCPVPSPRDSAATGEVVEYSTHSSNLIGRWNHTEWFIVTAKIRSNPQDNPWVVMIESSTVVSEEYTRAAPCSTGIAGHHAFGLEPHPVVIEPAAFVTHHPGRIVGVPPFDGAQSFDEQRHRLLVAA